MKNLCVFNNDEFGEVAVVSIDGKPYFEGIKVARILGYKNHNDAIRRHCKQHGIVFHDRGVVTSKRRDGSEVLQYIPSAFIDEGNLYRLIIKSRKEEAQRFESWVMDEVLPSIRLDGGYVHNDEFIKNLVKVCTVQYESIEKLKGSILDNECYVSLGKTITSCNNAISVGGFAKVLNGYGVNIGRNRLFDWFRANGYIMRQNGENQPKQVYIDRGLFVTKQMAVNTSDGVKVNVTTYITGKGQAYFINRVSNSFKYIN